MLLSNEYIFPNEWFNYYKGKNTNKAKLSFIDFCTKLYSINGEIIEDYIDYKNIITFKVDDVILHKSQSGFNKMYISILKLKDKMKENEDEFISLINNNNNFKMAICFKDKSGELIYDTANTYIKFVKGREKLIKQVKINGHKLLSSYRGYYEQILIDFNCSHQPSWVNAGNYGKNQGCPICSNKRIIKGVNDVATTHSHLVKYFVNIEDAYTHSYGSHNLILCRCPDCGFEKEMRVYEIVIYDFICDKCSDKITYPNKFMWGVLEQLKLLGYKDICFYRELSPQWCRFKNFNNDNIDFGVYDFIIDFPYKIIIEMDGGLSHGNNRHTKTKISKEEEIYKDEMKNKLAENNGYKIIRIDCNYPKIEERFNHIKENTISKIGSIFDLNIVKWNEVELFCATSFLLKACEMKKNNTKLTTTDISKQLKISITTVRESLKTGNKIGLCKYDAKEEKSKQIFNQSKRNVESYSKQLICITNGIIFCSVSECSRSSLKLLGVKLDIANISLVCRGKRKTTGGMVFKYISDLSQEEYILYDIENKLQKLNIEKDLKVAN